jgi:protein-S-isoprenylcysteine O-methyltransferase Ste14
MNTVITLYTILAIRYEEAKLVAEFGEQYREYQKAVPKLIPKW